VNHRSAPRTVTVLGCDGSYPGPGGAGSSYLVKAGGVTVLLDAGPGSFSNLQLFDDPALVDLVVLSHRHPDHWTDLESMAVWAGYGPGLKALHDPIAVYAPPGLRPRSSFADGPMLRWSEVEANDVLIPHARTMTNRGPAEREAPLTIRFSETDHGPKTLAVRFEIDGHGLVYSADTGTNWYPGSFLAGVNLFLCEATYLADQEGSLQHLSGRQAGSLAASAGVERLVITHRWPTVSADALVLEATKAFGGPVTQAAVGDVLDW
jgi:ribonuclease BN (tRNA processing enzyme)